MGAFLVKRLMFAVVTLFAVLTLVFIVIRIVPGDPALVILGDQADAAAIAALQKRLGIDRPLFEQYLSFLAGAVRGFWVRPSACRSAPGRRSTAIACPIISPAFFR